MKIRITKNSTVKIFTYEYDHLGRKVSFTHNGKPIVKYLYDAIGRLQNKKFSPSGTTQGSKQTGNWTDVSNWLSGTLPTLADNVTINTGQILTIPSGEKAYAGILNDKGTLRNFGTLNMGKATTTDLYTQSYKYHIRGGLRGINLDANNDLTNSLFSYKLTYEDGGFYDGNIGNQFWKSSIDGKQRAYAYQYDGDSRLKSATYASTQTGENYALNNVDYDANGNILSLSRNGATNNNFTSFGNVDNLTYTYPSNSNKLLKVQDATSGNTDLGDFRDGTNMGDDYEYWADGSLKKDKNKKIASITYNFLKRPEIITFDNGRTITTEYDADGTKLKKIDSNGEVTDYEEDDIYVNNVLYQTSHDEGRINAQGQYEYNITDHNNDLRVAFRDSSGIAVPTQSIFYDPWGLSMKGMQITRNPLNFNKYQFLNRETQFETGYIDLINRQFDPQTGRFTSQDPVTGGQEHLSLYQYGWNNPVLKPDPNGDCPKCGEFLRGFASAFTSIGNAIAHPIATVQTAIEDEKKAIRKDPIGTLIDRTTSAIPLVGQIKEVANRGNTIASGDANNIGQMTGGVVASAALVVVTEGAGKALSGGATALGGETQTVYRGVNSTSPAFSAAEKGVVKARGGVLGHSDPVIHNSGVNGTVNSQLTSWTTNPNVAINYALRTSGSGVVLSQEVPVSSIITSPNAKSVWLIQGGGKVSESEVLLRGTQRNLNIQKTGQ